MNNAWVTFDSHTNRWNVTGGGYWNDTAWFNDNPGSWWGTKGETKNVGGLDSVGITYYNTNGGYGSTSVISSLGYVTDHDGWTQDLINPSHGDGKLGVAFDFQDTGGAGNYGVTVNWTNAGHQWLVFNGSDTSF
ncbi:hypothetical protein [Paenibacillus camerounensis]|uniref:hypothetical protein n=1 Tax=Paenibacillus camerounensis TaxID=1243663 RepID=UPI0005A673A2|nr:hypothetical protein [Paenibacillus camerounensis]